MMRNLCDHLRSTAFPSLHVEFLIWADSVMETPPSWPLKSSPASSRTTPASKTSASNSNSDLNCFFSSSTSSILYSHMNSTGPSTDAHDHDGARYSSDLVHLLGRMPPIPAVHSRSKGRYSFQCPAKFVKLPRDSIARIGPLIATSLSDGIVNES